MSDDTIEEIKQKNAYTFEYDTLTYWGINPTNEKMPIFNYMRGVIAISTALVLWTTIMIQTFMETKLEIIIGMLYFSVTELTYICKLFNYLYQRKSVKKIDDFLTNDIFNSYTTDQAKYIQRAVLKANRLARVFRMLIVVCIFMYSLYPFIDNRLLPLDAWFPFSIQKYRYPLIAFQVFSVGLSSLINSSIDVITVGFISVATAHYEIIIDTLSNIKEGEDPQAVKKKVGHCANYQVCVTEFTNKIENVFSNGILMQFLTSIIVICLTGFELIVVPPFSAEFVMLISYIVLIMCQVSLYCWFGHDLMIKSQEVKDAAYLSEWNTYSPSIRKMLFIIMERSKRPIILTAGKFFFLTIPTLVGIFRSAYSYFAVLQHIYSNQIKK